MANPLEDQVLLIVKSGPSPVVPLYNINTNPSQFKSSAAVGGDKPRAARGDFLLSLHLVGSRKCQVCLLCCVCVCVCVCESTSA